MANNELTLVCSGLGTTVRLTFSQVLKTSRRSLLHLSETSSENITIAQARKKLKGIVGSTAPWSPTAIQSVAGVTLPSDQSQLTPCRMMDSYRQACIPLASDVKLREKYINIFEAVRFGRIMEDLDTMAVWISYSHQLGPDSSPKTQSPLSIVTAMVDRIAVQAHAISADTDLMLKGHVSWVGQSSIEVTMNVEEANSEHTWDPILEAKFLMVARDPQKKIKAFVRPLLAETPEEKRLFQLGEDSKKARELEKGTSLLKVPPSEDERFVVHNLFLQTLDNSAATFKHPKKPEGSVWMEDTLLKNIIICFPEKRNLYNKIFGGFLMRQAFELAWANACLYSRERPFVTAVDNILFRRPVEIGSILYLSSQVVYTEGSFLQIKVHAEVYDSSTAQKETTNIFHYTFDVTSESLPPVMPKSYAEYMMYLDGKRHFSATK